jgi:hypothetical protein
MKTSLVIIVTLALAASSANNLLIAASNPDLSAVDFRQGPDQTRYEGTLRARSEAPPR